MKLRDVVPECRVNLDFGKCFDCVEMERQGVLNIPYRCGDMNMAASLLGILADTITILDDGRSDVRCMVKKAMEVAPLAERVLIIKKEGEECRVYGKADAVCANRSQRQRKVYVC